MSESTAPKAPNDSAGTDHADSQAHGTNAALSRPSPTASVKILKALAHPVRQQLFRALTERGSARAADLAQALGLPANQVSFHLRVLADADMIKEAPELARDRRDRVWTTTSGEWSVGSPENPVADEALGGAVTHWVVSELESVLRRAAAWAPEYTSGRDSTIHGTIMNSNVWLTPEEFEELLTKFSSVLDDYRELRAPGEAGARHWHLGIIAADDQI